MYEVPRYTSYYSCIAYCDAACTHAGIMTYSRPRQRAREPGRPPRRARYYFLKHSIKYRGFKPKTAGIRIITFRDTTRMQSKSNRCI